VYPKIRSLHLCAGLFGLAFLLMYGASALQMAHRRWFPVQEHVTQYSVALPPGLTDARAAARQLMQQNSLRGELAGVQAEGRALRFRIMRPGTVCEIEYSAQTGEAKIRLSDSGLPGTLNRIHQTKGLWHEWRLLNAWAAAVGMVSLGLLTLGGTGLYLWFKIHRQRWIGAVMLAFGLSVAGSLIVWMRYG
jgi:hypothetical protein